MEKSTYDVDELMVAYMARQLRDGELVVQGMATPMVFSAFLLAKKLYTPRIQFMYTVGNSISEKTGTLTLTELEHITVGGALKLVSMTQMHCDIVPSLHAKEFIRPAQVDKYGNCNNVAIGPYDAPTVRLPGPAGIPDVLSFNENIYLYVPRHDRRTLVDRLDFCSSVGHGARTQELHRLGIRRRGPRQLITDKCVFVFDDGEATLWSIHPGFAVEQIAEETGFSFRVSPELHVTEQPTEEELAVLRSEIDPLQLRKLEMLSGKRRMAHIKRILEMEESRKYNSEP